MVIAAFGGIFEEFVLHVGINLRIYHCAFGGKCLHVSAFHYMVAFPAATLLGVFVRDIKQRHDGGIDVPLRYNYDKPEKPRISRVFGYLARFFILFQTEKSSREVVIS